MITISITLFNEIRDHAIREYPHECCGAILGELNKAKKIVTNVILLDNHWESISGEGKTRRFRITPKDYQYVELRAKDEGVTLLGFYHSHPDHPQGQVRQIFYMHGRFFLIQFYQLKVASLMK